MMNETRTTPYYIYNRAILQRTLQAINTARDERQHVHYAIKANANPLILEHIRQAGLGVDCVSGGEVQRAIEVGFEPSSIVFAGVGKADWEIRLALKAGIGCFNVESMPELEVINELALEAGVVARVALRINPNVDAHTHAKITTGLNENKFGLAMEDMLPAIRRASELAGVEYVGLHFHIGSQITEFEPFQLLAERINELQDELEQAGITTTRTINVGGGLGIDYEHPDDCPVPDFESYFRTFRESLRLRPHQEMHCELGRAVVAQCGSLITRVLYVKEGHQKKFVICDAGMTDLVRPAMYGSYHQCDNLTAQQEQRTTDTYDVVGPICESSDVFLKDYQMPATQRGDLLAFRSAGAYGEIMASQYNCRKLPQAVLEG